MASSVNNHYLLEVGTEELPPGFMETLPNELSNKIKDTLTEAQLKSESIAVHTTPRRIAIEIIGLAEKQESREELHKGPPLRIATDDSGNPTKAGEAFARKLGVPFSELKHEEIGKETYLTYTQHVTGKPSGELLTEKLPDLILGLNGPRFMRWGNGDSIRFARPIRWLVSLWNDEHLPIQIGELESDHSKNQSRGHRFLCEAPVSIPSAKDYQGALKKDGHVIVDREERLSMIREQLKAEAKRLNGKDPALNSSNDALFDEVVKIVEYPWVLSGSFDQRFLELPKEVVITVMAAHQKYFPVEKADGSLQANFLVVSNAAPNAVDTIRKGNERVLKARLEDARFFFDEDRKKKLSERLDELKGITFQRGLGTMYDKTQRLIILTEFMAKALDYKPAVIKQAIEAATLSKTDLVTSMVFELTELQGIMGRIYADHEGLDSAIGQAIEDQYTYAFEESNLAKTPVSIALSLADKIDTMVAVFSQEKAKMPTGSKDPLGLRRMANSIINIIIDAQLNLDLNPSLEKAYETIVVKDKAKLETVFQRFNDFMMQRLKGILLEKGYRYDMIDAVTETDNPFEDLSKTIQRLDLIKSLTQNDDAFNAIYEPANRIFKILSKNYRPDACFSKIEEKHLKESSEKALYKAMANLDESKSDAELLKALQPLAPTIETFFEEVLVNDKDESIKENRYNLLSILNRCYLRLGNFTKLVIKGDTA